MLSVSRATVSNRVNAISGFDWTDRDTFVDEVFDEKVTVDNSPNATTETGVKTTGDSSHNEGINRTLTGRRVRSLGVSRPAELERDG